VPTNLLAPQAANAGSPEIASAKRFRYQSLQVFRGLAALAVVGFHAVNMYRAKTGLWVLPVFNPGWSGVDFFFVLSGFIITSVHYDDFGKPDRLREYAWRRFIRVYPLYFLLTCLIGASYALHLGRYNKLTSEIVIKSFLLFPQRTGLYPIVNVGWTLSHEVFFYGLFGVLICVSKPIRVALVSVLLALTIWNCYSPVPGPYWLHTLVFSPFNFEFFAGCVAACLVRFRIGWLFPIGVVSLVLTWSWLAPQTTPLRPEDSWKMVLLFGGSYFLIVAGAASFERRRAIALPWILTTIGDATYSIYLAHFAAATALASLLYRLKLPAPLLVLAVLLLSSTFGYLVYLVVEKPMLRYLSHGKKGRPVAESRNLSQSFTASGEVLSGVAEGTK
jgi:peptidoglycan/LPS O-acetylase OafA/YrhL